MQSEILIVSHPKLSSLIRQATLEMPLQQRIVIKDVQFGEVNQFLDDYLHSSPPNAIITAGAHWSMLNRSRKVLHTPVIPLPITKLDLLQAALRAQRYGKFITLITFGSKPLRIGGLLENLNCECQAYSYQTYEEAERLLADLARSGADAVIGTSLICTIAESLGIPSVFIYSKESVTATVEHVQRLEAARAQMTDMMSRWSLRLIQSPIMAVSAEPVFWDDSAQAAEVPIFSAEPLELAVSFMSAVPFTGSPALPRFPISDLLFACDGSHEAAHRLITHDWDSLLDRHPHLAAASFLVPSPDSAAVLSALLQEWQQKPQLQIVHAFRGSECRAMLLADHSAMIESFIKDTASRLTAITRKQAPVYCGVSRIIEQTAKQADSDSLRQVDELVQEALTARRLAGNPPHGPVFAMSDSGVYADLYQAALRSSMPPVRLLAPLLKRPNAGKLLLTLRYLLDHELSITTAARYLSVTRQSVYATMRQIETLLGQLDHPDKRLALSIELRALELQKAMTASSLPQQN